jgi:hypothetical protein
MLPVVIVGGALGADETFRRYVREVAEKRSSAELLAGRYARSGAGRRVIAAMLTEASQASPEAATTRLMNMSRRRAVYVNAPPEAADPKNALQERYVEVLFRGAELLVWRGQGRCLRCGAELAEDNQGLYCGAHDGRDLEKSREQAAMTTTLRAVAEELGIASDRPRARRVRRTKH